jgi:hypothetical protein
MKEVAFEKEDFYNTLKKQPISDEDYETYLEDALNKKNRLEYLKHYNIIDTRIMIPLLRVFKTIRR